VSADQIRAFRKRGLKDIILNDDKSPLIDLMSCLVCKETMKIEKSAPDPEGHDIIQYRCQRCDRIELVRLFRRGRKAEG
jgi:transposase-like protein